MDLRTVFTAAAGKKTSEGEIFVFLYYMIVFLKLFYWKLNSQVS